MAPLRATFANKSQLPKPPSKTRQLALKRIARSLKAGSLQEVLAFAASIGKWTVEPNPEFLIKSRYHELPTT